MPPRPAPRHKHKPRKHSDSKRYSAAGKRALAFLGVQAVGFKINQIVHNIDGRGRGRKGYHPQKRQHERTAIKPMRRKKRQKQQDVLYPLVRPDRLEQSACVPALGPRLAFGRTQLKPKLCRQRGCKLGVIPCRKRYSLIGRLQCLNLRKHISVERQQIYAQAHTFWLFLGQKTGQSRFWIYAQSAPEVLKSRTRAQQTTLQRKNSQTHQSAFAILKLKTQPSLASSGGVRQSPFAVLNAARTLGT